MTTQNNLLGYKSTHRIINQRIKVRLTEINVSVNPDQKETFSEIGFLFDHQHPFKVNILADQLTDQYDLSDDISEQHHIHTRTIIRNTLSTIEPEILRILDIDYLAKLLVRYAENEQYSLQEIGDKISILLHNDNMRVKIEEDLSFSVLEPEEDEMKAAYKSEIALRIEEIKKEWSELLSKRKK